MTLNYDEIAERILETDAAFSFVVALGNDDDIAMTRKWLKKAIIDMLVMKSEPEPAKEAEPK
jgi:hypothetical protein